MKKRGGLHSATTVVTEMFFLEAFLGITQWEHRYEIG